MTDSQTQVLDRQILVLGLVVVAGSLLAILDATIVNVAVRTLGEDFDSPLSTIQWVMSGYLLAFASVIPLSGWASERFGAKHVWIGALLLFVGGSVLSGLAWSAESLIAFRLVQGVGGGLIMPVGQTILAQAAGPQRMGRVMSIIGVPMLLGPIFGPVIGGAIVGTVSWRWIFFINLPVGLLALLLAWRLLPASSPRQGERLDLLGLALLSPGVAIFVYGLAEIGVSGGLSRTAAVALAAGLALVAGFVVHALRRTDALLDLRLFASRGFAAATATNFVLGVALFGAMILLPLYYQTARGESPLATGLLLIPQGVGAALAMPLAGALTDRIGPRRVIPFAIFVALAGTAAFTQVASHSSYVELSIGLFLIGLGLGGTVMPSMAVAYQSVPREAVPRATSALNMTQRIAASIGTALLAVVLQHQLRADGADVAGAFGSTFLVAFGLLALSLVPALLLPRAGAGRVHAAPTEAVA